MGGAPIHGPLPLCLRMGGQQLLRERQPCIYSFWALCGSEDCRAYRASCHVAVVWDTPTYILYLFTCCHTRSIGIHFMCLLTPARILAFFLLISCFVIIFFSPPFNLTLSHSYRRPLQPHFFLFTFSLQSGAFALTNQQQN